MKARARLSSAGFLLAIFAGMAGVTVLEAWDYPGHRMVNELALASLPADFPAFVRETANAERIAFLAGEPDRWRNVSEPILRQSGGSWSDHFLDLEQVSAAGLDVAKLPFLRYDFILEFAAGRAAHADKFPPIDSAKNSDHTREWPGFVPWAIAEYHAKLKSAFSALKTFEELGTPAEIANARADVVYIMGILGHYVGDSAQPLHTTIHHNGWIGANPNGYTTEGSIHSWIDGGFIAKAGVTTASLVAQVTPAAPISAAVREDGRDPLFVAAVDFLIAQHQLVEPLYRLDQAKMFRIENASPTAEGRAFIEGLLLKGSQMLGAIWLNAWRTAPADTYLRGQLLKRQEIINGAAPAAAP